MTASLLAIIALAWPTLEQALDGKPLIVAEVPQAAGALGELERSAFSPWLSVLFPRATAAAVSKSAPRIFVAWYGTLPGKRPDVILAADTQHDPGPLADEISDWWTGIGFKRKEPRKRGDWVTTAFDGARGDVTLSVSRDKKRLGWAVDGDRAESLGRAASSPLSSDRAFHEMVGFAPRAQLRAVVHFPRLLGWLLRQPGGDLHARMISRLGLAGAQPSPLSISMKSRREVILETRLRFEGADSGVFRAIGPQVSGSWPAAVPGNVKSFASISVRPSALFFLASKWLSADNPLQHTLIMAQLQALESKVGRQLARDVLGAEPRVWHSYVDSQGERVLVLPVADGSSALSLISTFAEAWPGAAIAPTKLGGEEGVELSFGSERWFAVFRSQEILFGSSLGALRRHSKGAFAKAPGSFNVDGEATAFGYSRDLARSLLSRAGVPGADKGVSDRSSWSLRRSGDDWRLVGRLRR